MKYIPGEITGTMSGSIGAKTASHNKSGAYFRTKATPTNPNTIRQQAIRGYFGTCVNYWLNSLSAANRALWEAYAAAVPMTDKLGQTIYWSGQNHFVRSNSLRLQLGEAIVEAGPSTFNTGEPVTSIEMTTAGTPNTLGLASGGASLSTTANIAGGCSDNGDLAVFIGPSIPATWTSYKGPYQLMTIEAAASAATTVALDDALTALLNANGAPADGQVRPVRLRVVYDDGRVSQPYSLIADVEEET